MGRVALSVSLRRKAMRSRIAPVVAASKSSASAAVPSVPAWNQEVRPVHRPRQTSPRSRSTNKPAESSPSAASLASARIDTAAA